MIVTNDNEDVGDDNGMLLMRMVDVMRMRMRMIRMMDMMRMVDVMGMVDIVKMVLAMNEDGS